MEMVGPHHHASVEWFDLRGVSYIICGGARAMTIAATRAVAAPVREPPMHSDLTSDRRDSLDSGAKVASHSQSLGLRLPAVACTAAVARWAGRPPDAPVPPRAIGRAGDLECRPTPFRNGSLSDLNRTLARELVTMAPEFRQLMTASARAPEAHPILDNPPVRTARESTTRQPASTLDARARS
jgi:hypothetical protein